jgi:hypothetical protein
MTMDTYSLNYLNHLYENVYKQFSSSGLYPLPNIKLPQHLGKTVTQYSFYTRTHKLFSCLHELWYKWDINKNKHIKIIPTNIAEKFSIVSLAYWYSMDDGYFDSYGRSKTILLCTESFSKEECIVLQSLLTELGIKTTLKIAAGVPSPTGKLKRAKGWARRDKNKDTYRIRFSKTSMPL